MLERVRATASAVTSMSPWIARPMRSFIPASPSDRGLPSAVAATPQWGALR